MKHLMKTQKLTFGLLMAFVLVLGVQGVAEALTITPVSPLSQSKRVGETFEITFSVGLTSPTIAYNNESPRRRVTDHNTVSDQIRIDSQGYRVTMVNGVERRLLPASPTLTPTGGTAVLNTPHPQYTHSDDANTNAVAQAPAASPPYYVDTGDNVYNENGVAVYIRTGAW